MKCKCGTEYVNDAKYCYKCGRKTPELISNKNKQIPIKPLPAVLTVNQVADLLQVSRGKVYDLIAEQQLPWFSVGTHKRFNTAKVLEWTVSIIHGEPMTEEKPTGTG